MSILQEYEQIRKQIGEEIYHDIEKFFRRTSTLFIK